MPRWDVRFDLAVDPFEPALQHRVSQAEELAKLIALLPVPPGVAERVNRLNILRAVRGTTGLEGANLTEEEVGRVLGQEAPALGKAREREEQETRNAGAVMRFIAESLSNDARQPLTEALIRNIHEMTTRGITYPHSESGRYRTHNVSAGEYSAPPHEDVAPLMQKFVAWLHEGPARGWPALIRAVAAHFYFISIHPFGDGNGRTARAIESYLLFQGNVNVVGFYSLSNFYYRNRTEYIEMLDTVRFRSGGSLMPLLLFAARGLLEELETVRDEVLSELQVIIFREYAREVLEREQKAGKPAGERLLALLHYLQGGGVNIRDLRRPSHPIGSMWRALSAKTFDRDVQFLESHGLVIKDRDRLRLNPGVTRQPGSF